MQNANVFIDFQKIASIGQSFVFQDLLLLEEQEGSVNFKFGVIYAKKGQTTDDEMLSNGKRLKLQV